MLSRPQPSARVSSSSVASPTASHGEIRACQSSSASHMFPMPAMTRWSTRTSPRSRAGSVARRRATRSETRVASARRSGPSRRVAPASSRRIGPVPLRRFPSRRAQDEPRAPPPGSLAHGPDAPAPVHPEMAAEDDVALEPEQQVLSHCVDRLQDAAVDPLSDVRHEPARVGRRRLDPFADQGTEPRGRAME